MANETRKQFSYLVIVPRGVQNEISSLLKNEAKAVAAFDTNDCEDANHDSKDFCDRDDKNFGDEILNVVMWNEKEEEATLREALRDFVTLKEEKGIRQQTHPVKSTVKHRPTKIQLEEDISNKWLPPRCYVGSVRLSSSGQHVSMGYYPKNRLAGVNKTKEIDDAFGPCISCTGRLAGSVWMQLETNHKDVSQKVLSPSRMLGPLLALISVQTDNLCLEASTVASANSSEDVWQHYYQRYHQHSLEEMTREATRHIQSIPDAFSERLDRALMVWQDCVDETWKHALSPSEFVGLKKRIQNNQLRFRISCVRVEPAIVPSAFSRKRKKKFKSIGELFTYSRQELCQAIMDTCGQNLVPGFYDEASDRIAAKTTFKNHDKGLETELSTGSKSTSQVSGKWTVDLKKFDVELVIFVIPPSSGSKNGKLAFGISLRPYSFLQSKSFDSGHVPPDVTLPYLGQSVLSKGIIRLRPTTAHLLLQLANLQKFDIVLDPCAGIGTIPVEAEQYHNYLNFSFAQDQSKGRQYLSIGGDVILNNSKYSEVAGFMENLSRRNTNIVSSNGNSNYSRLLVAWDAAHLPIRTESVDVVVSDLPFGQQCLSVSALNQLLPLVFLECARVLTPTTGRMVVLAGGSPIDLIANIEKLSGNYWKRPILRVSPVSIGGILAWIIRADRNHKAFDRGGVPNQLNLVRKVAQKRDRISRQRKSNLGEQ